MVVVVFYWLKPRVMVWRDARCLKACVRLLSPPSVMFGQLIVKGNEMSYCCHYSLLVEEEIDGMESCKVAKTL